MTRRLLCLYVLILLGCGRSILELPELSSRDDANTDASTETGGDCQPSGSEICDMLDNDCNSDTADGSGELWYGQACDGVDDDLCLEGIFQCINGQQVCSDQTTSEIESFSVAETCNDHLDNDCDGNTDFSDGDCFGATIVLNLTITNVTDTSMDVTVTFVGDTNQNATAEFYFCNQSLRPSCDPQSNPPLVMDWKSNQFELLSSERPEMNGFRFTTDINDQLSIRVIVRDPDGIDGLPLETVVTLGQSYNVKVLHRSVGVASSSLSSGNSVTITGSQAHFADPVSDNIGVGDVLQYDSQGTLSVAFISARMSATDFTIQNTQGDDPPQTAGSTAVDIFRAFDALTDWQEHTEEHVNPLIDPLVRAQILYPSIDLITDNFIAKVACYDDGIDLGDVVIDDTWLTGAQNYIKIYTPYLPSQVGISQRHNGTFATGYRLNGGISTETEFVRLDGLAVEQNAHNMRVFFFITSRGPGEIHTSNCYGNQNHSTTTFDVYDIFLSEASDLYIWNTIAISSSSNTDYYPSFGYVINDADCVAAIYNATAVTDYGVGYGFQWDGGSLTMKNCLGYTFNGEAFNAYGFDLGPFSGNASNDNTAGNYGIGMSNSFNQTFDFVDLGGNDLHIQNSDTGARGKGLNLWADPILPFINRDIDDQLRPDSGSWDIGADQTQ